MKIYIIYNMHIHTYIYIYIYIEREREREIKRNREMKTTPLSYRLCLRARKSN